MNLGFVTHKIGPLPAWAWMAAALAALLIYEHVKSNKAPAVTPTTTSGVDPNTGTAVPAVTLIQEGFPSYSNGTNGPGTTVIPTPPVNVPPPVVTKKPPVVKPKPPAKPRPPVVKHPTAPAKRYVTVTPWNSGNPWSSTLSGISQHYYGNANEYMKIAQANHITNPNLIYPGQRLLIP